MPKGDTLFLIFEESLSDEDEQKPVEKEQSISSEIDLEDERKDIYADVKLTEISAAAEVATDDEIGNLLRGRPAEVIEEYTELENYIQRGYKELKSLNLPPLVDGLSKSSEEVNQSPPMPKKEKQRLGTKTLRIKKGEIKLTSNLFPIPKDKPLKKVSQKLLPSIQSLENALRFSAADTDLLELNAQLPPLGDCKVKWRQPDTHIVAMDSPKQQTQKKLESEAIEPAPKSRKNKKQKKNSIVRDKVQTNWVDPKKIPLEWFDEAPSSELILKESLINNGTNAFDGIPAVSKFHFAQNSTNSDQNWKWKKCLVKNYIPETDQYLIVWEDSQIFKWVRRFNLMFQGEKLDYLTQRMEKAVQARSLLEAEYRNHMVISEMSNIKVAPYPQSLKIASLRRFGRPIRKSERKTIVIIILSRNLVSWNWRWITNTP
jgi:hypothetical protein